MEGSMASWIEGGISLPRVSWLDKDAIASSPHPHSTALFFMALKVFLFLERLRYFYVIRQPSYPMSLYFMNNWFKLTYLVIKVTKPINWPLLILLIWPFNLEYEQSIMCINIIHMRFWISGDFLKLLLFSLGIFLNLNFYIELLQFINIVSFIPYFVKWNEIKNFKPGLLDLFLELF